MRKVIWLQWGLRFKIAVCHTDENYLNPFRAPKPLPILNPSNYVPKNGFPVVKGLNT